MAIRDFSDWPDDRIPAWVLEKRIERREAAKRRAQFLEREKSPEVQAENAARQARLAKVFQLKGNEE